MYIVLHTWSGIGKGRKRGRERRENNKTNGVKCKESAKLSKIYVVLYT